MKNKIIISFSSGILLLFVLFQFSCSDFLDVVPDNTPTLNHAFKRRVQAEAYLLGIYSFLPNFGSPSTNPAFLAGEETWLFDEFNTWDISSWKIAKGEQGTESPLCNYWASQSSSYGTNSGRPMFTGINDCNIFIENIHQTIDMGEGEKEQWIAEVKVLKAFFHFWLLQMYGPIPIIDENIGVGESSEETLYYREPVDDVVNYIVDLIDDASKSPSEGELPALPLAVLNVAEDLGRITLPIALAIKAKVLTLAASPLFNGNPQYVDVVDNRGIHLFPQSYDAGKWERAAQAIKEAIDACHEMEANHKLFDFSTVQGLGSLSPETILAMQVRGAATERWNEEIVWGTTHDNTALQRFGQFAFNHWNNYSNITTRSWSPTLATVKQFYTKNGVPIEEDKDWADIDLYELRSGDAAHRFYIEQNYRTINLHFDREARFYGAVAFDGGKWFGNGAVLDNAMNTTQFLYGFNNYFVDKHSLTGYLAKKMVHRMTSVGNVGATSSVNSFYRYAFPVIRLADLYLLYAEALNEVKEAPDEEVYEYIDLVRNRTGLEGVVDSWENYSIDPDKPSRKDGMREIIHRERMNELAFEGQRYWDLRRWKLLKEYMNKPIEGWYMFSREVEGFYELQTFAEPKFEDKDYLWPIRQGNLLKNKNLIQNPGWN